MRHLHRRFHRPAAAPAITIEGDEARMTTPEGRSVVMKLEALLARLGSDGPAGGDTRNLVLPDGVKWIVSDGPRAILVHQTPPGIHNLRWIAVDSPARFGAGTVYRQVRIALPYLIVLAVFEARRDGKLRISDGNECFFRTEPLRSPDDELMYPALLNCSKFAEPRRPLSWICTQHLRRSPLPPTADVNRRIRGGVRDLMACLLEAGFNYSSEEHEASSWFTESTRIDPRVSTIERWQEATLEDPLFVLDVPWLPVGKSVRQVAERCLDLRGGRNPTAAPRSSFDLARVLTRHGEVSATQGELEL